MDENRNLVCYAVQKGSSITEVLEQYDFEIAFGLFSNGNMAPLIKVDLSLLNIAKCNLERMFQLKVTDLTDANLQSWILEEAPKSNLCILTNQYGEYASYLIFLKGVQTKVREYFKSGFYFLIMSVDYVIIISDKLVKSENNIIEFKKYLFNRFQYANQVSKLLYHFDAEKESVDVIN